MIKTVHKLELRSDTSLVASILNSVPSSIKLWDTWKSVERWKGCFDWLVGYYASPIEIKEPHSLPHYYGYSTAILQIIDRTNAKRDIKICMYLCEHKHSVLKTVLWNVVYGPWQFFYWASYLMPYLVFRKLLQVELLVYIRVHKKLKDFYTI
jgi:hypothetical protein